MQISGRRDAYSYSHTLPASARKSSSFPALQSVFGIVRETVGHCGRQLTFASGLLVSPAYPSPLVNGAVPSYKVYFVDRSQVAVDK